MPIQEKKKAIYIKSTILVIISHDRFLGMKQRVADCFLGMKNDCMQIKTKLFDFCKTIFTKIISIVFKTFAQMENKSFSLEIN